MSGEKLSPDHFEDLMKLHQDPRAMAELGGVRDEAQTSDYLSRNLEHWANHGFGVFMVRDLATGESMGRVILRWLDAEGVRDVEIGYALRPKFWGHGLATEGARYLLDLARAELGVETLIGVTTPANHASQRVLIKVGFHRESEVTVSGTVWLLYRIRWPTGA